MKLANMQAQIDALTDILRVQEGIIKSQVILTRDLVDTVRRLKDYVASGRDLPEQVIYYDSSAPAQ